MLETLTILTFSFLLLAYFRPGKTPPLGAPLIVSRAQYRATFAPGLNVVEPFVSKFAAIFESAEIKQEIVSKPLYLKITDTSFKVNKSSDYLLTVEHKDGHLSFSATTMKAEDFQRLFVPAPELVEHSLLMQVTQNLISQMNIKAIRLRPNS